MAGPAAQLSMSMLRNIVKSYTKPGQVISDLLQAGPREDRALAFLAAGCVLAFLAQWPGLARQAHLEEKALDMLLGGALFGWFFLAPLMFYILALLVKWGWGVFGPSLSAYSVRVVLFWAFLAAAPLMLLHGLISGFLGQTWIKEAVGFVWFAVFIWFLAAGLRAARPLAP